ncbi:MAG: gliding motility-associated C-terminal domain-containing protein, partial [Bacteroidota bacterium]
PEKDSLYYVEYTTGPAYVYLAPEASHIKPWCVPFNLGIKLAGADFDGMVRERDSLVPDMTAIQGGVVLNENQTSRLGNCFQATGLEQYFLFGFFLDDTPLNTYRCIGPSARKDVARSMFIADNLKLERMKVEICCDTTICKNARMDFAAYTDAYVLREKRIIWNDGVEGTERSFPTSGPYRLTMHTNCGSVTSNWIQVSVEECPQRVFVPNAFSPNGDQFNPLFFPVFSPGYEVVELQLSIYNRWGKQIFQTTSVQQPEWDGTIEGVPVQSGIYKWQLQYGYREGDRTIQAMQAGDVWLLR